MPFKIHFLWTIFLARLLMLPQNNGTYGSQNDFFDGKYGSEDTAA